MNGKTKKNKLIVLCGITFFIHFFTIAQKALITERQFHNWPMAITPILTLDGRFIASYPVDQNGKISSVLKETEGSWEMPFHTYLLFQFSKDRKHFLFQQNDSLGIGMFKSNRITWVGDVQQYQLIGSDHQLILCQRKAATKDIIIDLNGKKITELEKADQYWLVNEHLLLSMVHQADNYRLVLQGVESADHKTVLWEGSQPSGIFFNKRQSFAAFSTLKETRKIVHICNLKTKATINDTILSRYELQSISGLSNDGRHLLLTLTEKKQTENKPLQQQPGVDIWSYKDDKLQPEQLAEAGNSERINACYDYKTRKLIFLDEPGYQLLSSQNILDEPGNAYVLLRKYYYHDDGGASWEYYWNPHYKFALVIKSLQTGEEIQITDYRSGLQSIQTAMMSPDGHFVIWYDPVKANYFSYDIRGHVTRDLTVTLNIDWTNYTTDILNYPAAKIWPSGIPGFTDDNQSVLIYNRNDIFKIDLSGKKTPVCLTDYYGRQHHCVIRLANDGQQLILMDASEKQLVSVYDEQTKKTGFYFLSLSSPNAPRDLQLFPYHFDEISEIGYTGRYLVSRQSAEASPNYFLTLDFKAFTPLTSVYPEKAFNWLTSELVEWNSLDGKKDQGILYKPENFDPNKKYPLIITYYEKQSDDLHLYKAPGYSDGELNVADYVSNGYLVFIPDILFTMGSPGQSSYNCVVSAAHYLSSRPYVDATKIGLQGHSFGGFQTNYIVTHTSQFACAVAGSGMTDFISIYGSLIDGGTVRQKQYEVDHDRMGGSLWDMPDKYIENSPVLLADKVRTPLLMLADKNDFDVPWQQGVEFFTGLRRLNKRAWMLQYDGQGHIPRGEAGKDYSMRMRQFFDYYLKGALPPLWMTRGVPAKLKGVDNGLNLDTSGAIP